MLLNRSGNGRFISFTINVVDLYMLLIMCILWSVCAYFISLVHIYFPGIKTYFGTV